MTENDILEIGFMLEEKGFNHSQIDAYFEHSGVKGMKWGVRRRGRIERTQKVGAGKGSNLDKLRTYAMTNPGTLVKTRSLRKSAARKGANMQRRNENMATGKAKLFKDVIPTVGAYRWADIAPSFRKKQLNKDEKRHMKKMSNGTEATIAALGIVGGLTIKALVNQSRR